ncbi:hypothetical protein J7643_05675 [bacterium]|nr:hypothetical protein [bacterium]
MHVRFHRGALFALSLTLILIGCNQEPPSAPRPSQENLGPTEKPDFVAAPTPKPSGPPGVPADWPTVMGGRGSYTVDFDAASTSLADWKDPREDDGHTYPWLYSGSWNLMPAIASAASGALSLAPSGGRALEHNDMRPQPALSFRRYAGNAFGTTDGQLPARYRVSLQVTPIASREEFYPPVGDQGTPVYYLDPTHYVEVLMKANTFEVWECNGGEPLKWRGWRELYGEPASHSARVPVTLAAEVDSNTGTIRVYYNGRFRQEVKSDLVKPYTHYFALRGASNRVQFDNLMIQSN